MLNKAPLKKGKIYSPPLCCICRALQKMLYWTADLYPLLLPLNKKCIFVVLCMRLEMPSPPGAVLCASNELLKIIRKLHTAFKFLLILWSQIQEEFNCLQTTAHPCWLIVFIFQISNKDH